MPLELRPAVVFPDALINAILNDDSNAVRTHDWPALQNNGRTIGPRDLYISSAARYEAYRECGYDLVEYVLEEWERIEAFLPFCKVIVTEHRAAGVNLAPAWNLAVPLVGFVVDVLRDGGVLDDFCTAAELECLLQYSILYKANGVGRVAYITHSQAIIDIIESPEFKEFLAWFLRLRLPGD